MLTPADEQDLLHAVSLIRRFLVSQGSIDKDVPASIKRNAAEITTYEATKELPQEPEPLDPEPCRENNDAEPSAVDQADGAA